MYCESTLLIYSGTFSIAHQPGSNINFRIATILISERSVKGAKNLLLFLGRVGHWHKKRRTVFTPSLNSLKLPWKESKIVVRSRHKTVGSITHVQKATQPLWKVWGTYTVNLAERLLPTDIKTFELALRFACAIDVYTYLLNWSLMRAHLHQLKTAKLFPLFGTSIEDRIFLFTNFC